MPDRRQKNNRKTEEKNLGKNKAADRQTEERRSMTSGVDRTVQGGFVYSSSVNKQGEPRSEMKEGEEEKVSAVNQGKQKPEMEQVSVNELSGKRPSRGRYFVGARIKNEIVPVLIDTSADISLAPMRFAEMGIRARLRKPFEVKAYDGQSRTKITETTTLTLDFGDMTSNIEFFSTEVEFLIIGSDLLRSTDKRMSLNTKTNIFKVSEKEVSVQASAEEAVSSWKKEGVSEKKDGKRRWATINKTTTIPAWTTASVKITANGQGDQFLSLFDSEEDKIFTPSIHMENNNNHTFWSVLQNKQDKDITLERGTPIGRMADTSDPEAGVFSYSADEVESTLEELLEEEEAAAAAAAAAAAEPDDSTTTSAESASAKGEVKEKEKLKEDEKEDEPVKMSKIINQNKVDNDTLDKCRRNGIDFDLNIEVKPQFTPPFTPPTEPINIEEEKKKSANCPYWPDEAEFQAQFKLEEMDQESETKLRELLSSFKHIFANEKYPEQFKKGILIDPIKVTTIPGAKEPKPEPVRRLNPVKLNHLKQFLKQLSDQGVIKEYRDFSKPIYLSPVHIVLEERYVASEKKVKSKARFCLDQRVVNKLITPVNYPPPLPDEFRRKMASGNTIFSCLDASNGYHQIVLDTESVENLFGFRALGRIYVFGRLSQGWGISVGLFQSVMDALFAQHPNCNPYLDDLGIGSKNLRQHFEQDLPLAFGICSRYNILLKGSKADLAKNSTRVLGFEIGGSTTKLSCEKRLKIEQLKFPTTKKEAVSAAAFFAYFLQQIPMLSEKMSGLRRLARPNSKFTPTAADKAEFEDLKRHLLDPTNGVLRTPSNDPDDQMIVFTDASKKSLGAILTQMMRPLPGSQLDPTKRYLTIVGCWSKVISEGMALYPPFLLELLAFCETSRLFNHILQHRPFILVTDNQTVEYWASLEAVPTDVARKIIKLQKFDFKVVFVESRLNPSDWVTRLD